MCGLVGWFERDGGVDPAALTRMRDSLARRGPDDAGLEILDGGRAGLGFRRLSILDLSEAGHQPMATPDKQIWIIFNGEVYNFAELRHELEGKGHSFRSGSDTEVVLAAYQAWGERCLERFIGMFSLVIWDGRQRKVFAARDRLGIKPLLYTTDGGRLVLASELRAIMAAPGFSPVLDGAAMLQFFERGYVAPPATTLKNVRSLEPGHYMVWTPDQAEPRLTRYWSSLDTVGQTRPARSMADLEDELTDLALSSVRYRLVSDVPLGAFLSGGLDSSLIAALMKEAGAAEVRTFTIGFEDPSHDEAQAARAIAQHLGTTHTELLATEADALAVARQLPDLLDEPFADSSFIPTWLVCHLTRQHATVALSGDGGDELFAGYDTYRSAQRWETLLGLPLAVRKAAAPFGFLAGARGQRAAHALAQGDAPEFVDAMWHFFSHDQARRLLRGRAAPAPPPAWAERLSHMRGLSVVERLALHDIHRYLPGDILTKVDRASMATSLEVRVPLLDHRVVEFATGIPLNAKLDNGRSKLLLRKVLRRFVPDHLMERPKHGFSVPLGPWLIGPLAPLVEEYLGHDALAAQDLLDPGIVRDELQRFRAGQSPPGNIWALLIFQMWMMRHGLQRGAEVA